MLLAPRTSTVPRSLGCLLGHHIIVMAFRWSPCCVAAFVVSFNAWVNAIQWILSQFLALAWSNEFCEKRYSSQLARHANPAAMKGLAFYPELIGVNATETHGGSIHVHLCLFLLEPTYCARRRNMSLSYVGNTMGNKNQDGNWLFLFSKVLWNMMYQLRRFCTWSLAPEVTRPSYAMSRARRPRMSCHHQCGMGLIACKCCFRKVVILAKLYAHGGSIKHSKWTT